MKKESLSSIMIKEQSREIFMEIKAVVVRIRNLLKSKKKKDDQ